MASPGRLVLCFFFSSRRRHTRFDCDWSSDVCSSDLDAVNAHEFAKPPHVFIPINSLHRAERLGYPRIPIRNCRSEEHTSELQSQSNLVCRLLLEKKKKKRVTHLHVPQTLT